MTRSTALLLSGAFYVAVATVWTWPLATAIGTHTALRVQNTLPITRHDQTYSISAAARNAAAIRDGDWQRLLNWRTCYPMPKSATLGEHAFVNVREHYSVGRSTEKLLEVYEQTAKRN